VDFVIVACGRPLVSCNMQMDVESLPNRKKGDNFNGFYFDSLHMSITEKRGDK
jgi:hypothetical protein